MKAVELSTAFLYDIPYDDLIIENTTYLLTEDKVLITVIIA